MKILPLNFYFAEELTTLFNTCFSDYIIPMQLTIDAFESRLETFNLSWEHSLVAQEGEDLLGIILIGDQKFYNNPNNFTWIGGMGVIPEARKQKIAHKLLEQAHEQATQRGQDIMLLEVIAENTKAISLYQSFNYKKLDELVVLKGRFNQTDLLNTFSLSIQPTDIIIDEPALTPWQSRSLFNGEVYNVSHNANQLGQLLVVVDPDTADITIKQIQIAGITHIFNIELIHAIFEYFGDVTYTFSNISTQLPIVDILLTHPDFELIAKQHLMAKGL